MKPHYHIGTDPARRTAFIRATPRTGRRVAVHNQVPLGALSSEFDAVITLKELYDDQTFLRFLATVDRTTTLFYMDMGLDYCSFKGDYIAPYLRLHPLYQQAGDTYIVDGFAFYNTEKSIYRPFLYLKGSPLKSSVQEFYNVGPYADYTGNRVENYAPLVKPHLDLHAKPTKVTTVRYKPTAKERAAYEALKEDLIMKKQYPKTKVVRLLLDFVDATATKRKAVPATPDGRYHVLRNDARARVAMYKALLANPAQEVVFYTSGHYGADEMELGRTRDALLRHNTLIALCHG